MKHGKRHSLLSALLLLTLASCGQHHHHQGPDGQEKHKVKRDCVYVCTGPRSKRYHSVDDCMGLQRCSASIVSLSEDAAADYGYTPCHLCVED